MLDKLKSHARALKNEVMALYFAMRDPRTPWLARLITGFVVAHTLSPIDLIPDFIPILGYLDDLIIAPAGIWLAVRLIPPEVMDAARLAATQAEGRPNKLGWIGAAFIILLWVVIAVWVIRLIFFL